MADFQSITENIARLELPWRVYGVIPIPVAVYLIRREDGFTLVDSGPPESADQLVPAISKATGGAGIDSVLLTHGHYDHVGGLNSLDLAWKPEVLCHREEAPFLRGDSDYHHLKAHSLLSFVGRYLMPRAALRVRASKTLEAGQAAAGMAVIHLPGHTPGQIGFLHPTDQAMICGDAAMNLGGQLSGPISLVTPNPMLAQKSLRRLAQLDYDHLLPTHGPPIMDHGQQAMRRFVGSRA
jgi:glyoxylase-like metal-dependent hydrolase (beta-lactamase superfamily II)